MVWRLMPNIRATAEMDRRSDKAASTCAWRSGEVVRGFGWGVKVLLQSLQRHLVDVPEGTFVYQRGERQKCHYRLYL